jgi:hypothetical protein
MFAGTQHIGLLTMYATQAIEKINEQLKTQHNINLTNCICNNKEFNSIVIQYQKGFMTLEDATLAVKNTIIQNLSNE